MKQFPYFYPISVRSLVSTRNQKSSPKSVSVSTMYETRTCRTHSLATTRPSNIIASTRASRPRSTYVDILFGAQSPAGVVGERIERCSAPVRPTPGRRCAASKCRAARRSCHRLLKQQQQIMLTVNF